MHVFVYLFFWLFLYSSIYPFIYLSPYLFNSVYVLTCWFIYWYEIIHMSQDLVLLPSVRKWQAPSHAVEMTNKKSLMSRHFLQSSDMSSLCFCPKKTRRVKGYEKSQGSHGNAWCGEQLSFSYQSNLKSKENGAAMALCKPSKPCSKRWTPAMFLRNCSITSNGKHHFFQKEQSIQHPDILMNQAYLFPSFLCQCLLPLKSNPNPSKKPQKVTCFTVKPKHQNASPTRAQGQNARVVA